MAEVASCTEGEHEEEGRTRRERERERIARGTHGSDLLNHLPSSSLFFPSPALFRSLFLSSSKGDWEPHRAGPLQRFG